MSIEAKQAPDFSLPDQDGKIHTLKDYRGKKVVLYFYPRDDTPGCTTEACDFKEYHTLLQAKKVVVLGVSADSVESHKKFAQKHTLPFALLADEQKQTIKAYGAWGQKSMYGKVFEGIVRTTVVIDEKGVVQKVYPKVSVTNHVRKLVESLDN